MLLAIAWLAGGEPARRPTLGIDGEALHANALEIAGFSVRDVLCRPRMEGARLHFEHIEARAYGGRVSGRYAIDLWDEGGRPRTQELYLEAAGLDLTALLHGLGASTDSIEGRLHGWAELTMPAGGAGSWSGRGELEIRDGSLVQLPFLVNFLAGNPAAARGRDRLQARFVVVGGAVRILWLVLDSPALQLSAQGRIGFDGTLDIAVTPRLPFEMVRRLPLIGGVLAGGLGRLTASVTQAVIRGHLRQPVVVFDLLPR